MSPPMQPFSQVIEPERRRWMPFRRTLSQEDQEAFDQRFADATQQLQTEVHLGRAWPHTSAITKPVSLDGSGLPSPFHAHASIPRCQNPIGAIHGLRGLRRKAA
jgi:hypothetical protein